MAQCASCMHVITDDDNNSIKCYGLCGNTFHLKCLNKIGATNVFNKTVVNFLNKISGMRWYCEMCQNLASNGVISNLSQCTGFIAELKTSLVPLLDKVISADSNKNQCQQAPAATQVACNFLDYLRGADTVKIGNENFVQIEDCNDDEEMELGNDDDDFENTVVAVDSSEPMDLTQTNPSKRKISSPIILNGKRTCTVNTHATDTLVNDVPAHQQRVSTSNVRDGPCANMSTPVRAGPSKFVNFRDMVRAPARLTNKLSDENDLNRRILPQASDLNAKILSSTPAASKLMKSVCISRFSNDVTCEDILNHFRKYDSTRNIVNEIRCKRLTRSNRHISSYTFISFKLTFPRQYFERITSREVWNPNAIITEFVDKRQSSGAGAPGEDSTHRPKNWARHNGHVETVRNHTPMYKPAPQESNVNNFHFNPFTQRQVYHTTNRTPHQYQRVYSTGNRRFV